MRYDDMRREIADPAVIGLIQFMNFGPKDDFHFLIQLKNNVTAAEGMPLIDFIMRLLLAERHVLDVTSGVGLATTRSMETSEEAGTPVDKDDPKGHRATMRALREDIDKMLDHKKVSDKDFGSGSLHSVPKDKQLKIKQLKEASQANRNQKTSARRQATMERNSDGVQIIPFGPVLMPSWTDDDAEAHQDADAKDGKDPVSEVRSV